ncbi:MAG: prolyl oligopeptidase family serine peptidase, partial [Gammaproteobacteria bacterium]
MPPTPAMKQTSPYGAWESPISAELVASAGVSYSEPRCDGALAYWLERRPLEKGRTVIVCRDASGRTTDISPADANVRTRANEYGGGTYAVADGKLYFVNDTDRCVHQLTEDGHSHPLTHPEDGNFADLLVDGRLGGIVAVRERHRPEGEPENTLVRILPDGLLMTLAGGVDFYSSPTLSPDGRQLAWLQWNHPNMPWDGTELWMADVDDEGHACAPRQIAGGPDESVFQPAFSPDGRLYFVSDRSDWWNLYRCTGEGDECICPMEAEFGLPQWVFGMRTYAFKSADEAICLHTSEGLWHAASLCLNTGELRRLNTGMTHFNGMDATPDGALMIASNAASPSGVFRLGDSKDAPEALTDIDSGIDGAHLSEPRPMPFPSEECTIRHALFYPPTNADFQGPEGELPPVIVKIHGGPTAQAGSGLSLGIQFWTSRGFAFLDVNYGGSTGYGRRYRNALRGQWGEMDLDDCVNAVLWAANDKLINKDMAIIRGSSAGGYTTLAALTFRDVFKAGASYYGISDLEALAQETHKFESRYTDRLVAPYPARKALYEARSPIHHSERLNAPVIFFQGLDDKVVPPNQASMMAQVLREKGLPVAHLEFEGEGHGFRQAETVIRCLE